MLITKNKSKEIEDISFVQKVNDEKTIDFNKMDKETLVNVICELIIELKKNKGNDLVKEDDNEGLYNDFQRVKKQAKKYKDKIMEIARYVSSTYQKMSIEDNADDLNVDQIIDMVKRDFLQLKKENQSEVIKLQNQIIQQAQLLIEIRNQQEKIVANLNKGHIESNPVEKTAEEKELEEIYNALGESPNDDAEDGIIPDANFKKVADGMTTDESNHTGIAVINFDDIKKRCGDIEYDFMKVLGELGYSLYPEIESALIEKGYTTSKIDIAYNNLRSVRVIEVLDKDQSVKTFLRKSGVRVLWLSKDVGIPFYVDNFKNKPVIPEKDILIKENDNLQHGYSIKETCEVLTELGFKEVIMDRKKNTIDLGSGKFWIPDIIAIDPVSNKKIYFEVEFANHTKDDFEEKLTKANMKANTLRIITNSPLNKAKLINKVKNWKATKATKTTSIVISVGTFMDIKAKNWGDEFN